jgi:hypothetical protein
MVEQRTFNPLVTGSNPVRPICIEVGRLVVTEEKMRVESILVGASSILPSAQECGDGYRWVVRVVKPGDDGAPVVSVRRGDQIFPTAEQARDEAARQADIVARSLAQKR